MSREEHHPLPPRIAGKVPCFNPLFDSLEWASSSLPLHLCLHSGAKLIQKLTPGFKNHMRDLENFRQAVESAKSRNSMGYFCPRNTFLQSTACVKIHQILYAIFKTISHFSRHNSSVFFSSDITAF